MLWWIFNPPPGLKIRNPTTCRGVLKLSEETSGLTVDPTENLFQRKRVPQKNVGGWINFVWGVLSVVFFKGRWLNLSRKETKKDGIRFSEKLVLSVFFSFLTGGDKNDICPKGVSQMWKILNEKSSMTGGRSKKPREASQKGGSVQQPLCLSSTFKAP